MNSPFIVSVAASFRGDLGEDSAFLPCQSKRRCGQNGRDDGGKNPPAEESIQAHGQFLWCPAR